MVQNRARLPGAEVSRLEQWLRRVVAEEVPAADSLGVCLDSDAAVRRVNRQTRGRDASTDVLSFTGDETLEGRHVGDILVALPVARRQAAAAGHSLERELKELLLHGLLHCLGFDHEGDDGEMVAEELRLRGRWIGEGE